MEAALTTTLNKRLSTRKEDFTVDEITALLNGLLLEEAKKTPSTGVCEWEFMRGKSIGQKCMKKTAEGKRFCTHCGKNKGAIKILESLEITETKKRDDKTYRLELLGVGVYLVVGTTLVVTQEEGIVTLEGSYVDGDIVHPTVKDIEQAEKMRVFVTSEMKHDIE